MKSGGRTPYVLNICTRWNWPTSLFLWFYDILIYIHWWFSHEKKCSWRLFCCCEFSVYVFEIHKYRVIPWHSVKTAWALNRSVSAGFHQAYSQLHSLETQHSRLNRGWIAFPNTPNNFLHASSFIGSQNVHFVPAVSFCMAPRKCEVAGNFTNSYLGSRLHYTHCLWWNRNSISCK